MALSSRVRMRQSSARVNADIAERPSNAGRPVTITMLNAKKTIASGNQNLVIPKLNNELPNVHWT
jgi:hypothetical protein